MYGLAFSLNASEKPQSHHWHENLINRQLKERLEVLLTWKDTTPMIATERKMSESAFFLLRRPE